MNDHTTPTERRPTTAPDPLAQFEQQRVELRRAAARQTAMARWLARELDRQWDLKIADPPSENCTLLVERTQGSETRNAGTIESRSTD